MFVNIALAFSRCFGSGGFPFQSHPGKLAVRSGGGHLSGFGRDSGQVGRLDPERSSQDFFSFGRPGCRDGRRALGSGADACPPFISRYFQRPLYDYRTVWRTLTEGIVSRVKQADLCQAAVTLISEISRCFRSLFGWWMKRGRTWSSPPRPPCRPPRARGWTQKRRGEGDLPGAAISSGSHDFETLKDDWAWPSGG